MFLHTSGFSKSRVISGLIQNNADPKTTIEGAAADQTQGYQQVTISSVRVCP